MAEARNDAYLTAFIRIMMKDERSGGCILQIIRRSTLKLKIQCKKGMYFSFDFGWYSIHFDIIR